MKVNLETGGIEVQVVLNELIENVFVSPNSPKWLTDLLKDVTLKFGYNFPVINSSLSDTPLY
ncbi:MAG TPA: hypothetical protein VFT78_06815 [Hanamia sp.]|nr:hypothetical protein [Hanamia sp.]